MDLVVVLIGVCGLLLLMYALPAVCGSQNAQEDYRQRCAQACEERGLAVITAERCSSTCRCEGWPFVMVRVGKGGGE